MLTSDIKEIVEDKIIEIGKTMDECWTEVVNIFSLEITNEEYNYISEPKSLKEILEDHIKDMQNFVLKLLEEK